MMGLFRKKTDLVYAAPAPRNLKRVYIIIAIIIIAMVAISFALKVQKRSSFQSASLTFFKLIQNGDASGSYEYLAPSTKQTTTKREWQNKVDKLQKVFKNQTPKLTKENDIRSPVTKNSVGYLDNYTISGTDGTYTIDILMANSTPPKVLNFSSKRTGNK